MSDFEPFDDELAAALRRRSASIDPSGLSTATAHDAVLVRARGIRRRRAGIAGGLTMVALVAGGFLLLDGGADDSLAPASDPSTTLPDETLPVPSSTLAPTTVAQTVAPTGAPTLPTTVAPPPAATTTAPAVTDPAPTTETQTSAGGSITYSWNGSSLDLLSIQPAAGYTAETEDDTPTRIRVRFRGAGDSRIEVRVEGGVPVVDID